MNTDKKTSYLFSLEGSRRVLECLRNIIPQVLFGSMWIVFFHRLLQVDQLWERVGLLFLTCLIGVIFFYSVLSNLIFLTHPMMQEIDRRIQSVYAINPLPKNKIIRMLWRIKLACQHEKILSFEIFILTIFVLVPIFLVIISSVNSAEQIYRTLFF